MCGTCHLFNCYFKCCSKEKWHFRLTWNVLLHKCLTRILKETDKKWWHLRFLHYITTRTRNDVHDDGDDSEKEEEKEI